MHPPAAPAIASTRPDQRKSRAIYSPSAPVPAANSTSYQTGRDGVHGDIAGRSAAADAAANAAILGATTASPRPYAAPADAHPSARAGGARAPARPVG